MNVQDLIGLLNAMPPEHEIYINNKTVEEIQLTKTEKTVNIILRGGTNEYEKS